MPAAAPLEATAPASLWTTTANADFRYFSFGGTKGQSASQAATGVRGSGEQFYLPFGLGLTGQPSEATRFDLTVRGGYVDSRQTTVGFTGAERTALDTQISATVTYLDLPGVQPFFSLNLNLPTGDTFLGGNRFRARLDSDLVDVPVFGEGLNVGPTIGFNLPIGQTMLASAGIGYTLRGEYAREGVTDAATGLTATTRLEPGNSTSANASLLYQEGAVSANLAVVYMTESATRIDGARALRSGDRISLSATGAYAWSPEWATTLSGSFTHTENNFTRGGALGALVRETFNANSNLYRVGLDTLYTDGAFGVGPTLSFLYRDRNTFDARTLLFVPQRERYGAGGLITYALSDAVSLTLRGERIFVREALSPDKIFDPFGVVSGTGQPRISYRGYSVGGGATFKFEEFPMRPFVIAVAAILLAGPAALAQSRLPAPPPCTEGRLADGRCVDPVVARLARNQTICLSQIKLSYIACPGTLPGRDARYKYPYTVVTERQREIDMLYERQAYQNVFGTTVRVRTTIVAPPVTTLPATTTRATTAR